MKRLMLLPALALALAGCGEAPTAPLASPGVSQFDQLADPNADLAFANEGETTHCSRPVAATEATCTFEITGAGSEQVYVSSHIEWAWTYECVTKNPRTTTRGVITQITHQMRVFSGDPIAGSFTHTTTQPTDNPCPRKGKPTLNWGVSVQYWYVYADNEDSSVWICKSSDETCR